MRTEDIKKLDEIGFIIVRPQDYPEPIIMWFKHDHWEKLDSLGDFETNKKRDAALEALHERYPVIID